MSVYEGGVHNAPSIIDNIIADSISKKKSKNCMYRYRDIDIANVRVMPNRRSLRLHHGRSNLFEKSYAPSPPEYLNEIIIEAKGGGMQTIETLSHGPGCEW